MDAPTVAELYRGNLPWLPERTIFFTRHGSHAYGLATETSDLDLKGICIPPREYFHGFLHRFEQAEVNQPADCTIYDIRKFCALAADCNPNIIEVLWADESDWLHITPAGRRLIDARSLFLSTKARHTFSGYAIAQLKRIKTHRKWLLNPPTVKPTRAAFGLPEKTVMPADDQGAIRAVKQRDPDAEFPEHVMEIYEKERAYGNAMREFQQFENWKKNRNEKRADLERRYGYDCKHAMHLVRLLRMCREILRDGKVFVKRHDREELLAIRNGAWSYDELIQWAEAQDAEMKFVEQLSTLPHAPDRAAIDRLCIKLVEAAL